MSFGGLLRIPWGCGGWVPTPEEEWRQTVAALVQKPIWVIDGNLGGTMVLRVAAADTVVFLDMRVTMPNGDRSAPSRTGKGSGILLTVCCG